MCVGPARKLLPVPGEASINRQPAWAEILLSSLAETLQGIKSILRFRCVRNEKLKENYYLLLYACPYVLSKEHSSEGSYDLDV